MNHGDLTEMRSMIAWPSRALLEARPQATNFVSRRNWRDTEVCSCSVRDVTVLPSEYAKTLEMCSRDRSPLAHSHHPLTSKKLLRNSNIDKYTFRYFFKKIKFNIMIL